MAIYRIADPTHKAMLQFYWVLRYHATGQKIWTIRRLSDACIDADWNPNLTSPLVVDKVMLFPKMSAQICRTLGHFGLYRIRFVYVSENSNVVKRFGSYSNDAVSNRGASFHRLSSQLISRCNRALIVTFVTLDFSVHLSQMFIIIAATFLRLNTEGQTVKNRPIKDTKYRQYRLPWQSRI